MYECSNHIIAVLYTNKTILLKWFYDTSPGTATRAARGGLLIGGTKALDAEAR
jgi:hypothetical protein